MSSTLKSWCESKATSFSGQLLYQEPLSRHSYYRIGGPAPVIAIPKTLDDLVWLSRAIQETGSRYIVLGLGSNILVSDEGVDALVIRASRINLEISIDSPENNKVILRTGASVAVSSLMRRASQEGWAGLEFLTGIPGSIGGVVTMNAGTHLGETQSKLKKVEVFSLSQTDAHSAELQTFQGDQLQFEYRKNLFLPRGSLVWAAEWEIQQGDPKSVKAVIDDTLARRKATQPIDYPSCGSVFKNPKAFGISAWQVIDRLGLRGYQVGGAQFAEKHSNFIINLGNAKASDVRALIELAQERAQKELGIRLETEVIFID
jgi:UDP-N-acetylmuramate dehydrogenase